MKTAKKWYFPPLRDGQQGRIFTKHYTNLSYCLNRNHFCLLTFLIYQSGADNVVEYRERLLKQYRNTVIASINAYGGKNELHISLSKCRFHFQFLIENGLLLKTDKPKLFLINPNLTFSKLYVKAEFYKQWVHEYQDGDLNVLANKYIDHVENNYRKRKN